MEEDTTMTTPPDATKAAKTVILPSIETPTLTKAELSELLFDNLGSSPATT